MRCLTLAGELKRRDAEVLFISRQLEGDMCGQIARTGFEVWRLPVPSAAYQPKPGQLAHAPWLGVSLEIDAEETIAMFSGMATLPDWLIVDSYALDARWERQMRPYADQIMVIDDLADRPHDCDLLLDQNLFPVMADRYNQLVPDACRMLMGPAYALLRGSFLKMRSCLSERDGVVRRILVFFGGSDPTGETAKALEAIQLLKRPDIQLDVVIGDTNPNKEQLRTVCARMINTTFHCQIDNMAELMAGADLAVGASGTATWERCCLALPALVISVSDNQHIIARPVADSGAIFYLGDSGVVTIHDIHSALVQLLAAPARVKKASLQSSRLVDGSGVFRVLDALCEGSSTS